MFMFLIYNYLIPLTRFWGTCYTTKASRVKISTQNWKITVNEISEKKTERKENEKRETEQKRIRKKRQIWMWREPKPTEPKNLKETRLRSKILSLGHRNPNDQLEKLPSHFFRK